MLYSFPRNWNAAIGDFTELLKQDPQNSEARVYRGRCHSALKQWNPAVEDFSAAIHLDPMNSLAFYYRGCILRKYVTLIMSVFMKI